MFGGCCEHFLILLFTVLFVLPALVCMCVCEWSVLMASVLGFSSRVFPYKVFLLVFPCGRLTSCPLNEKH